MRDEESLRKEMEGSDYHLCQHGFASRGTSTEDIALYHVSISSLSHTQKEKKKKIYIYIYISSLSQIKISVNCKLYHD